MLKTEDLLDGGGGGDEKRMGLKQCASLLMRLSPPHPIPSCFGARARPRAAQHHDSRHIRTDCVSIFSFSGVKAYLVI